MYGPLPHAVLEVEQALAGVFQLRHASWYSKKRCDKLENVLHNVEAVSVIGSLHANGNQNF